MQQPVQRLAGKPHVPRKATTCRSTAEVKIIEVPPRNARPIASERKLRKIAVRLGYKICGCVAQIFAAVSIVIKN